MSTPQIQLHLDARRLSPSQGFTRSVIIILKTKIHEILEDPTTGSQTLTESNPISPPLRIDFNLRSCKRRHIRQLLRNRLMNLRWLSGCLASRISTAATNIGFGRNGFVISVFVTITFKTVLVTSPLNDEDSLKVMVMKLVLGGRIDGEDLKDLKMETESCAICLENLSSSNPLVLPTRMTCSHVFHDWCLLDWLQRENTCPLCRIVLYER